MQVTKNITLDLLETGSPVIIKAKQNDRNTRYISAHLYVDGLAYPVPNGTEIAFRYKKPDGTAGFYDTLPDNSPAITVSGNTVTVELVEQVLTVSGCVHCEINMYNATSEKLTTFTFEIAVEESVLTDAEIISSDYYNALTAEIAKALQAVTDATEQAENAAQSAQDAADSAQDAADSAAMSKDWAAGQPVTYSGAPVSIAYAGAQRIASITAYGKTPQGGTTEAPVALTGVDSVQVCGRNLLPDSSKTVSAVNIRFFYNTDGFLLFKGQAYTFASNVKATGMYINLLDGSGKQIYKYHATSVTYTPDTNVRAWFDAYYSTGVPDGALAWLNLGESPLPYEPYQGSVTPLPIPRPLRRVRDVRDVCQTRVKSVYDKRIVLDGSESWTLGSAGTTYWTLVDDIASGNHIASSYLNAYENDALFGPKVGIAANSNDKTIRVYLPGNANPSTYFASNPLIVYYQSTAYDGTNGLDVCLTEYQTGFVEPDGETLAFTENGIYWNLPHYSAPGVASGPINSHFPSNVFESNVKYSFIFSTKTKMEPYFDTVEALNAYLTAQKEAGTPVQLAYKLATPEVYATDPLDIDNAAGPLTIMTGGELEVRMTELIGSRSDVSNNTVAFSEASQDADIQTGEKLSVLFGKIKKRLSLLQAKADNSLQTTVKTVIGAINEVLGRTKATKTTLNASDALSPTGNRIAYVYTQGDMKTLLAEMSSLGNFDAGRTLFVFAGDLRPSSMICFTGFIDRAPKTFFIYPNGELKTLETSITLNQTLVLNVTYK